MRGKKFICAGIGIAGAVSVLASGVLAYWKVTGRTVNILTTAAYRTELVEEYTEPNAVYPDDSVDKTVNVRNSGTADTLVRIQYTKAFGSRSEDGNFTRDDSLDPEMIEITCNENYWKQIDGYWYYKDILKAGETTKEPLFEEFHVSEKVGNAYRGKDAQIVVTMESIQAEGDAASALWGISEQQIDIVYESEYEERITSVAYAGNEAGFTFDGLGTDLFSNFKNLLPGCARTQKIRICNNSASPVSLYLHAEPVGQNGSNTEELLLIKEMLEKYAQIEIKTDDKILYSGAVDGNPENVSSGDSMGEESTLLLGTYSTGEEKELIVTLKLSPDMETKLSELTGKVQWVFTAVGEEVDSASVPKTGDDTPLLAVFLSLTAGNFLLLFAWYLRGHRKKVRHQGA